MNMDIGSDEMTLFRDMARRAFEQEIAPHFEQWEEDHLVPRELWNTLGAAGLLCPDVDEAYGGAGTTPHVTLMLIEELSRMGFGGVATGYGIHSNIVAPYSAATARRRRSSSGCRRWSAARLSAPWR
jgi:acyl-CoA dehydrogenase